MFVRCLLVKQDSIRGGYRVNCYTGYRAYTVVPHTWGKEHNYHVAFCSGYLVT